MKRLSFIFLVFASVVSITCPSHAQDSTIVITPDLELVRLTADTWLHVSYAEIDGQRISANGLIYLNSGHAFIADTPWTDDLTDTLFDWLENNWRVNISGVVATHWHEDCMGGINAALYRGVTTYGQSQTSRIGLDKGLVAPQSMFGKKMTIKMGSMFVQLAYYGGGHTIDNSVVWILPEKILFAGDLVRSMTATSLGNLDDAVLDQWPDTIKAVREAYPDVKIVVPGHGPWGGPELFDHTLELLEQQGK